MFPPRRNIRLLRTDREDAAWADTLDWKTNDYDFHRLLQCLCDRLDLHYREEFGLRLDQLADREELDADARLAATWYRDADRRYRTGGIYDYLYSGLDRLARKRASRLFGIRHELAERLMHMPREKR